MGGLKDAKSLCTKNWGKNLKQLFTPHQLKNPKIPKPNSFRYCDHS